MVDGASDNEATGDATETEVATIAPDSTRDGKKRRIFKKLVALPYLIGVVWTLCHPIVSVITGEPKCRGSFIDESSLDPYLLSVNAKYPAGQKSDVSGSSTTLCNSLLDQDRVSCFHHEKGGFDVAKVVPTSNAVEPTAEVIVVVVPAPTSNSELHAPVLHLLQRLSTPTDVPWLAKTVLVVSPTSADTTLTTTIASFLDSYLGPAHPPPHSIVDGSIQLLPPSYTSGMIRNLVVLDASIDEHSDEPTEIRILPQGRRGVLPNMDYVFTTTAVYQSRGRTTVIMHPHGSLARKWAAFVETHLSAIDEWAKDLGHMLLFIYTLAMGPYPPHAAVLDRGIDSITIEAVFRGSERTRMLMAIQVAETVQNMEHLIRALSNLHERLHHSLTLYLLPSPKKFVSHSEYLIPNILLLLPLVMRVLWLLFVDMDRLYFQIVGKAMLGASVAIPLLLVSPYVEVPVMNGIYTVVYMLIFGTLLRDIRAFHKTEDAQKNLQFVACLLAIYLHVPITLAHMSLSYPSALVWTPRLAFSTYNGKVGKVWLLAKMAVLFVTWPPFRMVPNVFESYTPYVLAVYTPLHIVLSLLWLV